MPAEWAPIVAVLLLLLIVLPLVANKVEKRRTYRTTVRKRTPPQEHVHHWITGESIDGIAIGRCQCGESRLIVNGRER